MRVLHLASAALIGTVVLAGSVVAQDKPTGIVAYRSIVMKSLGAHSGALKSILTDQTELIDQAALHANTISETAKLIPAMFPEGSDNEPTEALPVIWEDSAGFEAASQNLAELAAAVATASESGDVQGTLAAFAKMGKEGCGGCHDKFREKN